MKNKIFNYFKNNIQKKHLVIFGIGLFFLVFGFVSWNVYFSKFYIFQKTENYFLSSAKDYYEYHSIYLPKEGSIKTITLEEMYERGLIDTLYQPKSRKLCDTDSWVKVYNNGKNYEYYTYLNCGKYKSEVDHEGPVITLKGDSTVYVTLNKEYEELGVEKVVDNVDGNMDIKEVTIDNSKVNTKKVGKYNVTYTIRDTLNNETVVTRKVIVARNLTDTVKDSTSENGYYQGNVQNNYVLFSGVLYRIINVNEDGTITLISHENLNNLRANYENYENSNIDQYLNNEYLNIIHDPGYLVDTEFCVGNIDNLGDVSKYCDSKLKRKVALLDISKFQNTFLNGNSFLCTSLTYSLSSKVGKEVLNVSLLGDNCLVNQSVEYLPSIKPVITLKSNLIILSGDGTYNSPYKLNDYSYGKQQDKLNTRLVGEYVNYSGSIYRIMNIDNDNNVALISIDGMTKTVSGLSGSTYLLSSVSNDKKFVFNITDKDNPGYILNNDYSDYINDSYILKHEYQIPTNTSDKMYNKYTTKKVSAKLSLPKTYDLFSGKQSTSNGQLFLYIDESQSDNKVFFMNIRNAQVYEDVKNIYGEYGLKIVITIKGDLLIKSGNGTINNPYYVR